MPPNTHTTHWCRHQFVIWPGLLCGFSQMAPVCGFRGNTHGHAHTRTHACTHTHTQVWSLIWTIKTSAQIRSNSSKCKMLMRAFQARINMLTWLWFTFFFVSSIRATAAALLYLPVLHLYCQSYLLTGKMNEWMNENAKEPIHSRPTTPNSWHLRASRGVVLARATPGLPRTTTPPVLTDRTSTTSEIALTSVKPRVTMTSSHLSSLATNDDTDDVITNTINATTSPSQVSLTSVAGITATLLWWIE